MSRYLLLALACITALSTTTTAAQRQSPTTALDRAAAALSAAPVQTLEFTASGRNFSVGQNYTAADPWPPVTIKSYTAVINYETASMRVDLLREMGAVMPRGGGAPFFGEQRQTQVISGAHAWNVAAGAGGAPPTVTAQPAAHAERLLWLWTTPHGFIRAARANNATVRAVGATSEVTFRVGGKYDLTGTLDASGQLTRVRTRIYQPTVGDMPVETTYADYKDFGGVTFPARITQTQDGFPSLELQVSAVKANSPADMTVPENVVNAPAAPPVQVTSQQLAEGVFHLTGGSHHSLLVEMRDHLVILDLPQNQARAEAVLAKAKEVVPSKPVRYVVTGHHHWDHLGGIRAAFAENATVVTHESNAGLLTRIASAPHSLVPDRQATAKNTAKLRTVSTRDQITDGTRVIELHLAQNYEHSGDMLLFYLPQEKILAEADIFTPPAQPGTPLVVTAVPAAKALLDNIRRLNLDVTTIVPLHGNRTATVEDLTRAANP